MGRANSSSYRQRFRHVFTINMSEWLPEWDDVIFIEWTFRKWEENNRFYFSSILHNNGFICAVVILGRRRDRSGSPPLVILYFAVSLRFFFCNFPILLFSFFSCFMGGTNKGVLFIKETADDFAFLFLANFFPRFFCAIFVLYVYLFFLFHFYCIISWFDDEMQKFSRSNNKNHKNLK